MNQIRSSPSGVTLPPAPPGHLAVSGDISGCHDRVGPTGLWWDAGMLLNTIHVQNSPLPQIIIQLKLSRVPQFKISMLAPHGIVLKPTIVLKTNKQKQGTKRYVKVVPCR